MAQGDAVAFIDKIQMGIDLDHMDGTVLFAIFGKGVDARDVDRMVTANGDRDRARFKDSPDAVFDIGVAFLGLGVDDIGVPQIDNPDVLAQIGRVILVVIGPCVAKAEQG